MIKIGYSSADITPDRDAALIGYEFRRSELPAGNAGVLDPLNLKAFVLDSPAGPAVLVALDLCIIEPDLARHWRKIAAEAAGTVPEKVIISCSHTHSGPFPRMGRGGDKASIGKSSNRVVTEAEACAEYTVRVETTLKGTVAAAAGLLLPYSISWNQAPLGLGYNRRVISPAGLRQCWNPQEQHDLMPGPSPDPQFTLLVARQLNGPREIILWGHGAHPVVLGKTSRMLSADWPGCACRMLEAGHPYRYTGFFLGACGNIHPWIATQDNAAGVGVVGGCAAAFAELIVHGAFPMGETEATIETAADTITLGGVELDLAVWRWGGLWIAAVPVELFAELGAALRKQFDAPLFLISNANGWTGYWPHAAAFAEGGYEIDAARAMGRNPGDGEKLIEAVVTLAQIIKDA